VTRDQERAVADAVEALWGLGDVLFVRHESASTGGGDHGPFASRVAFKAWRRAEQLATAFNQQRQR
jgi:hypothetical protein